MSAALGSDDEHLLRYDTPASRWTSALPLGNGRTGAMVFGRPGRERLQLNDSTAWSGGPDAELRPPHLSREQADEALGAARRAIADEDHPTAERHLQQLQHRYSQSYLPFADLWLTVTTVSDGRSEEMRYERRCLDLRTGTHESHWSSGPTSVHTRSWIAAQPDVLVVEIDADPGPVDVLVELTSELRLLARDVDADAATVSLRLQLPTDVVPPHDELEPAVTYGAGDALRAALFARVHGDGEVLPAAEGLRVTAATTLRLVLATATTFTRVGRPPAGDADTALAAARGQVLLAENDPATLREHHLRTFADGYARCALTTGSAPDAPLDERLLRANTHPGGAVAADPALAGLLFNYGRYLLWCSSRPGGPPANLQGLWNQDLRPVWSSNYTTNINLQMNYWPAQVTGLTECIEPLFDLVDALSTTGSVTARQLYGARGWVAHHNTDIWAYSKPVGLGVANPRWAFWPMAGVWLVRQLWEHLEFGSAPDAQEFALRRVLPPLRGVAEFCLDWLQLRPDGSWGTCPSTSPENEFLDSRGNAAAVDGSTTMDLALIRDALEALLRVSATVGVSTADPLLTRVAAVLPSIPLPGIGADGALLEWSVDRIAVDPQHRHLSPAVFAFPGDRDLDGPLGPAVSALLDERGDESTGWSLAWKLALRARLRQGDRVDPLLALVFRDMTTDRGPWVGGLYPNLFSAHPPFQIDGNLGYVAGIAECLVQSHRGVIEILPALPSTLAGGAVSGLVARPGVVVDLEWAEHRATSVRLRARRPDLAGRYRVLVDGRVREVDLPPDGAVEVPLGR